MIEGKHRLVAEDEERAVEGVRVEAVTAHGGQSVYSAPKVLRLDAHEDFEVSDELDHARARTKAARTRSTRSARSGASSTKVAFGARGRGADGRGLRRARRRAMSVLRWRPKRVRSSGLAAFDGFLGTLDTWMDPITNYFENRDRHGFVEGFNTRVKVLKRRCHGIFNVDRIFQRRYLDLDGYRLFGIM
jgi:hypothetical protein